MRRKNFTLLKAVLLAGGLASGSAQSNTSYVADFNGPGLDAGLQLETIHNISTTGTLVPGVSLPWIVGSSGGYLSIAKTFTLPGQDSDDLPMVATSFATAGDFVATVVANSSYNGASPGAFFIFYNNHGFTGLRVTPDSANNDGLGNLTPDYHSFSATPTVTLRLERHGDTLVKSYKPDGAAGFIVTSSFTSPLLLGDAYFQMSNRSNGMDATAILFQHLTISAVPEPATFGMLLGGLAVLGWRWRRRSNA